jgi:hypothetical protein
MWLFPSKPREISNPEKLIETLKELGRLENYQVQLKKNGSRGIIEINPTGKVTIYDRKRITLAMSVERDWSSLAEIFPVNTLLDGELIGRKQGEVSNRLYLWDMPICEGFDLSKISYLERYEKMISFWNKFSRCQKIEDPEWQHVTIGNIEIGIAKSYPAENWKILLENVNFSGSTGENEGVVFKNTAHHLSWNQSKTVDIKEQVKFLLKYQKI